MPTVAELFYYKYLMSTQAKLMAASASWQLATRVLREPPLVQVSGMC